LLAYQPLSEGGDSLQKNGLVYGAIELEVSGPASHAKLRGACRYRIVPMAGPPKPCRRCSTDGDQQYRAPPSALRDVVGLIEPWPQSQGHRQRHKRAQLRELWEAHLWRLDTPPDAAAAHSILIATPSYAKFTQRMDNVSNV